MRNCTEKNEYAKLKMESWLPLITTVIEVILALLPLLYTFSEMQESNIDSWAYIQANWLTLVVESLLVVICFWAVMIQFRNSKQYYVVKKRDEFSKATLKALKDANEFRRRAILRTTYGNVPEWNALNYTRNILLHDEHEHIRNILYSLSQLIVGLSPGLSEDDITVDLIACYPQKGGYSGEIPMLEKYADDKFPWRMITSGDHTSGGKIKEYLYDEKSFYSHVNIAGFDFFNEKHSKKHEGKYSPNEKDRSSNSNGGKKLRSKGSIVGMKIELRNDAPEAVFVKGILTITTYGKNLYNPNQMPGISEETYKQMFKECILDSFKALIRSEFAQVYVRHALRDGDMCPKTGHMLINTKNASDERTISTIECPWSGAKCNFAGKYCGKDN